MASYESEFDDLKSKNYDGIWESKIKPAQFTDGSFPLKEMNCIDYKYGEGKYLEEIKRYVDKTYSQHYRAKNSDLQCIDVWFANDSALTSCRDVIMKYLWRVGKKGNKEEHRKDVMKAIHYCFFILHALDSQKEFE